MTGDRAEPSAGTSQYRPECHFDDCDTVFIGADRSDYIDHLEEDHGRFVGEIYDALVVGKCEPCGIVYQSPSGDCPLCNDVGGTIRGEFVDPTEVAGE